MGYFLTLLLIILGNTVFGTYSGFAAQSVKKNGIMRLSSTQGKVDSVERRSSFVSFAAINEKTLWAVAYLKNKASLSDFKSLAFQSTDGGFSWKQKLFLDNEVFFDIHFVNAQIGWIVGYRGLILKTTDGGENWKRIQNLTKVTLSKIQFLDPKKGWLMGKGQIWSTDDGGENWLAYNSDRFSRSGNEFISFSFPDELEGWMIGNIGETGELVGEILSTTDGGMSWQSRSTEVKEAIKKSRYFDRNRDQVDVFNELKFFNSKKGYVIATIVRKAEKTTSIIVLKTEDRGRNWTVISRFDKSWFVRSQFINENEIWISELSDHRLLHTSDGGKTWEEKVYPLADDLAIGPIMIFINPNNCWLFSPDQSFFSPSLYTSDGGKTWEKITLRIQEN